MMIGQTIGKYKILEKLGEGGMGVVWKAEDVKLKRLVALKFLSPQSLGSSEEKTRFIHEAQAAASLEHSNICTIYDFNEIEDKSFIAMSYVDGPNLRQEIEAGPLEIGRAVELAIQMAEGLQAAHEKNIIHRDIKTANVMLTSKGQVKITDFGLARLPGRTRITKTGSTMGTVAYMAPEQARGEEVDQRTDIWSLGVVIYEMATGRVPFQSEYEQAVVYAIMNETPERMTGLRKGMPVELERIVEKALQKDRDKRYQTAADLAADLVAMRNHLRAISPVTKSAPRRRRLSVAVAGVIVLTAAALLLTLLRGWIHGPAGGSKRGSSLAVLHFRNLGAPGDDDYLAAGITEEIITDLAALPHLQVASRTAVDRYRGKEIDPRQVGGELGVGYVLEGSIQHSGNELRVTAQLISTKDGFHVWAKSYGGTMADIFAVQDSLAARIAEALRLVVRGTGGKVPQRWTQDPEAYAYFLMGRESYFDFAYENDYGSAGAKAMHWYQKAIALDPNYAPALAGMADMLAQRWFNGHRPPEALDEALALAKRAQAVDPQLDIALRAEGRIYMAKGDYQQAREVLERALVVNPSQGVTYKTLASVYSGLGLRDEALDAALRGIRADPGEVSLYFNLVEYYMDRGDYVKADEALQEGLERLPDAPWLLLKRADLLMNTRRNEEQMATLQRLAAVEPEWRWRVAKKIGDCYLALNQPARADSVFRSILRHNPDLPEALHAVGQYELDRGHPAAAESLFTRASSIDPDFYPARLNLARSIAAAGRKDEAERIALDLAVRWPDDASVCADISEFMRTRLRRFDAAREWAERATQLDPQSAYAQRQLAWSYFAASEYEKAIEGFQAAIRLRPDAYWDYVGLARAQGGAGHVHEAIEAAERAVELKPDYIPGLMILGYDYVSAGDRHRAATAWERIVALDSTHSGALNNLAIVYDQEGKHHKALEMFEKAARADTANWLPSNNVANLAFNLEELDKAREAALHAIARAQGNLYGEASGYLMLGRVDERAGREQDAVSDYEEGLERIERALRDQPQNADIVKTAGYLCAKTGDVTGARGYATWLAENRREFNADLYEAASIMSLTGERARALEYLEWAVAAGFDDAFEMSVDKDLDSIRDDPRFKKLIDGLK